MSRSVNENVNENRESIIESVQYRRYLQRILTSGEAKDPKTAIPKSLAVLRKAFG